MNIQGRQKQQVKFYATPETRKKLDAWREEGVTMTTAINLMVAEYESQKLDLVELKARVAELDTRLEVLSRLVLRGDVDGNHTKTG